MEPSERNLDPQALLAEAGWLRGLAQGLVGDSGRADDVVQETWVAALERGPKPRGQRGLRDWLAAVARNLALRERRREAVRPGIERAAARPEAVPGGQDAIERMQLQRQLADAILALDEPYRSAVILRHLDGLSSGAIAEEQKCTPQAARQRVSRGLRLLREELDRRGSGDSGAWSLALLEFCRSPTGAIAPSTAGSLAATTAGFLGGTLMSMKVLAVVIGAGLGLSAYVWFQEEDVPLAETGRVAAAESSTPQAPAAPVVGGTLAPTSSLLPTPSEQPGASEREHAEGSGISAIHLHGRVLDTEGREVEGATVELVATQPSQESEPLGSTTTNESGEFALTWDPAFLAREPDALGAITARRDGYITDHLAVGAELLGSPTAAAPVIEIVLVQRPLLSGHLLDPEGNPVIAPGRAQVVLRHASGETTEHAVDLDEEGIWTCRDLAPGHLVSAWGRAKGFAERTLELERYLAPGAVERLDITLPAGAIVRGIVVEEESRDPIPFAEVWAEAFFYNTESREPSTVADARGHFELRGVQPRELETSIPGHAWIQATARADGYAGKGFDHHLARPGDDGTYWVEIPVQAALITVNGLVLQADGRPAPSTTIYSLDSRGNLSFYSTDDEGRFRIEKLPAGSLGLCAFQSLASAVQARVQTVVQLGRGVDRQIELRLEEERNCSISGRVVDVSGNPLPNEGVRLGHHFAIEGMTIGLGESLTETDELGYFEFADLLPGIYHVDSAHSEEQTREVDGSLSLTLAQHERHDDVRLAIDAGVVISGWVDLGPLSADAFTVQLRRTSDGGQYASTTLDPDGAFTFNRVFPFDYEALLLADEREIDRSAVDLERAGSVSLVAAD